MVSHICHKSQLHSHISQKTSEKILEQIISFFFFFFLIHQFITQSMMADHGSYFRNYIQKKHTNMKVRKRRKGKRKG